MVLDVTVDFWYSSILASDWRREVERRSTPLPAVAVGLTDLTLSCTAGSAWLPSRGAADAARRGAAAQFEHVSGRDARHELQ